jgi:hypothetical protein
MVEFPKKVKQIAEAGFTDMATTGMQGCQHWWHVFTPILMTFMTLEASIKRICENMVWLAAGLAATY